MARSVTIMAFTAVALLLAGALGASQARFDVASIKENAQPGDAGGGLRRLPDGSIRARHFRARFLITLAYGLQPYQLVGAPAWTYDAFYDIDARPAPGSGTTRESMNEMMQALLIERFGLQFHRETRMLDGFVLVRVRPNALGQDLKPSAIDCDRPVREPRCREGLIMTGSMNGVGAPIWSLLQVVINEVGAPVADETGLAGTYDWTLRWSTNPTATDDAPVMATALQEQLGLKLERRQVSDEVFVIDRFERPTPN